MTEAMSGESEILEGLDVLEFESQLALDTWLKKNHTVSKGIWLRLAKKVAGGRTLTYAEALESALCHGWIDGQRRSASETSYLQKFTPRTKRSIWSKINCQKALDLIEAGRMMPAGQGEVDRAKADGRWDAAYAGQRSMTVPGDLQAALDGNAEARSFFATLDSKNRYAVLFRIHAAKKAETRARRIQQFVDMLARHEKLHPS